MELQSMYPMCLDEHQNEPVRLVRNDGSLLAEAAKLSYGHRQD